MKNYELTCLISSKLSEAELKLFQEKIIAQLQKEQGILIGNFNDEFAKKKLGYLVKKNAQAYLINFNFQIDPEGLKNLEKELNEESNLLRYTILVKKPVQAIEKHRRPIRIVKKISQPKVELKEIEKKLEEILGE